jgi:hypothetical protein
VAGSLNLKFTDPVDALRNLTFTETGKGVKAKIADPTTASVFLSAMAGGGLAMLAARAVARMSDRRRMGGLLGIEDQRSGSPTITDCPYSTWLYIRNAKTGNEGQ